MKKSHMYGMMLGMMAMANMSTSDRRDYNESKETKKLDKKESDEIYYKNKKLTRFEIDGKIIYALNYKNALRKSKQSNP